MSTDRIQAFIDGEVTRYHDRINRNLSVIAFALPLSGVTLLWIRDHAPKSVAAVAVFFLSTPQLYMLATIVVQTFRVRVLEHLLLQTASGEIADHATCVEAYRRIQGAPVHASARTWWRLTQRHEFNLKL